MRPVLILLSVPACSEYELKGGGASEGALDPEEVAALLVDPLSVDFGQVAVGGSADAVVTATNVGAEPLLIESVALGEGEAPFDVTFVDVPALLPGESTTFVASFSPDYSGEFSAAVSVVSDAPIDGEQTVSLAGRTGGAWFTVDPEHHDFGTVTIGTTDAVSLVITNVGDESGSISDPRFVSTSETELYAADYGALGAGAVTLAPGEQTSVSFAYGPTDETPDEGTFSFSTSVASQPSLAAVLEGSGVEGDCETSSLQLEILITADDAWRGWLDGVEFTGPNAGVWSVSDTVTLTTEPGCEHVIAIYAQDLYQLISGLFLQITMTGPSGTQVLLTGSEPWLVSQDEPSGDWTAPDFDDSGWQPTVTCSYEGYWGGSPADLYATGARWVWWDSDCTVLGDGWFRLKLDAG